MHSILPKSAAPKGQEVNLGGARGEEDYYSSPYCQCASPSPPKFIQSINSYHVPFLHNVAKAAIFLADWNFIFALF